MGLPGNGGTGVPGRPGCPGTNAVFNGGFEILEESNLARGWTVSPANKSLALSLPAGGLSYSYEGLQAELFTWARATGSTLDPPQSVTISQSIDLCPNQNYEISMGLYNSIDDATPQSDIRNNCRIELKITSGVVTQTSQVISGTQIVATEEYWGTFTWSFTSSVGGPANLIIRSFCADYTVFTQTADPTGVWIDGLIIVPVP